MLSRRVAALSNGELRKLLLARAMLARPRLLLLDDPLGGLDPQARPRVTEALVRCCDSMPETRRPESAAHAWRETGDALTIVVTTPRPEELEPLILRTVKLDRSLVSVPRKNQASRLESASTLNAAGKVQSSSNLDSLLKAHSKPSTARPEMGSGSQDLVDCFEIDSRFGTRGRAHDSRLRVAAGAKG